jgi:putative ABC transport system ATP-binding protein
MGMDEIVRMEKIYKYYSIGAEKFLALRDVELKIYQGEFVSVFGPSGSGKTTLMNIIGCLDVPSSGSYYLSGERVDELGESELSVIRNRKIGFVFQQFHLLPRLNVLDNTELPLIYAGMREKERKEKALLVLERVGLGDKIRNLPNQLSGGQQQRVAIARAMVTGPVMLLADEPTGNLDQETGHQILDLFQELNSEGTTVIIITHDSIIARYAGRTLHILDGRLISEEDKHV